MGRAKKKSASSSGEFSLFDDGDSSDSDAEEDLPRDEAGRAKIKNQYVDLLGIRVQKLAGRILNRERINKTLEGVYFVCIRCQKVCHNLDEGLVEDADNVNNLCVPCSKAPAEPDPPARPARSAKAPAARSPRKTTKATTSAKTAPRKTATKATAGAPAKSPARKPATSRTAAGKAPAKKAAAAKAKPKAASTRTAAPKRRK